MNFATSSIQEIDTAGPEVMDELPFGVIGFDASGTVQVYSLAESRMAGLSPDKVVGKHIFAVVAPCMNNFMVAQRFEDEQELDATIDYVLTLKMRPTPVKLRMLKSAGITRRYLLIQR